MKNLQKLDFNQRLWQTACVFASIYIHMHVRAHTRVIKLNHLVFGNDSKHIRLATYLFYETGGVQLSYQRNGLGFGIRYINFPLRFHCGLFAISFEWIQVTSAKVIRNKQTGQSEGYGFLEFVSRATAERVLQTYNGTLMPNSEQNFRLNWATLGAGERRIDDTPDYTIFVGDLASDVTDYMLQETFRAHYASVKGAKVVTDRTTGRSKGYGFVRFGDESEQLRAMTEMNGMFCSTRPMRIGPAATKKAVGGQQFQKGVYFPI